MVVSFFVIFGIEYSNYSRTGDVCRAVKNQSELRTLYLNFKAPFIPI